MDGKTVKVRVQVIDLNPKVLDVNLPVYLTSGQLTQIVAREAGLQSHWPDRSRRLYWLRARGRLMNEHEKLEDLGVINNELVYLLPQPPPSMGLVEQNPDYPRAQGYSGKALPLLISTIFGAFLWSFIWAIAVFVSAELSTVILPGLGLGIMAISFSRHAWGGQASRSRVFLSSIAFYVMLIIPAALLIPAINGIAIGSFISTMFPGILAGFLSLLLGWIAWWGPVEALPPQKPKAIEEAEQEVFAMHCFICGGEVEPNMLLECVHQCGRIFHKGCHEAQCAIYRGPPEFCQICRVKVL